MYVLRLNSRKNNKVEEADECAESSEGRFEDLSTQLVHSHTDTEKC